MTVDLVVVSRHLEQTLGVPPLIRLNGKAPLDAEWPTGPRKNPNGWRRRLVGHQHNVGMLTGQGLVAVDVDLYHPDGEGSFERLRELGLPIETVTQITGGGGRHYLYRTDTTIRSAPLAGFPGIDVKADGGQVVVAPSTHPDTGQAYEWEHTWAPGDVEPLELPADIVSLFVIAGENVLRHLDERDEASVNLLIEHFGGHHPRVRRGWVEVCRPGKEDGASATVGRVGAGVVKVWSSNWTGLPAGVYGGHQLRKLAGVNEPKVHAPGIEPPDGFRWWQPGDDAHVAPTLAPAAYHGAVGQYMAHITERSEAHPAAVGFTIYAYLGVWLERAVVYSAGRAIRHHPALWGALVGETASGGKGMAGDVAELFLDAIDPVLVKGHSINGIASGPALIDRLRPADADKPPRRVVVHEHELANVLKMCEREGSTLSGDLRKAYDLKPLGNLTREHGDRTAEGYFLGAIGSITPTELRHLLDEVSIENGFANRWLLLHCEISHAMPRGDTIDDDVVKQLAHSILGTIGKSIGANYRITDDLAELWDPFYVERRTGMLDESPLVRVFAHRQPAHAARLAITFAAIDGSTTLRPADIEAATAWCDYSLDTVRYVFGDGATGDAGKLLAAIRSEGVNGLDGTAQHDLFSRNLSAGQLAVLRAELERRGLIWTTDVPTGGRPRVVSFPVTRLR